MGEHLFWAIRGGGGASFGVITAWKVQLVDVPEKVTVFNIGKTLEQNATQLIHKWQSIAPEFVDDLFLRIIIKPETKIFPSYDFPIAAREKLLNRLQPKVRFFKAKSDYVQKPIPGFGLEGVWRLMLEAVANQSVIIFSPYGGRMAEIPASATPFPHRTGKLVHDPTHHILGREPESRFRELHKLDGEAIHLLRSFCVVIRRGKRTSTTRSRYRSQ
ncbi:berberine bridge enzyme-like 3 [Salvia hispanica]|uniref:berberine bridge enzyme-like 3 n=1 Tax=Salvia hispanica TaxID=49212 RepID=UPI00200907D7|nr:berberine bridge enzyme-like 3 [Salvia hispanica]